jgi:hypothetical protein
MSRRSPARAPSSEGPKLVLEPALIVGLCVLYLADVIRYTLRLIIAP